VEDLEFSCSVLTVQALEEAAFAPVMCPEVPQKRQSLLSCGIDVPESQLCHLADFRKCVRAGSFCSEYYLCSASNQSVFGL